MRWLFLLLFLISCSNNTPYNQTSLNNFNYSDDFNLEKFKSKLDLYVMESSYPDINE